MPAWIEPPELVIDSVGDQRQRRPGREVIVSEYLFYFLNVQRGDVRIEVDVKRVVPSVEVVFQGTAVENKRGSSKKKGDNADDKSGFLPPKLEQGYHCAKRRGNTITQAAFRSISGAASRERKASRGESGKHPCTGHPTTAGEPVLPQKTDRISGKATVAAAPARRFLLLSVP
jgi:hypothetical protein